MCMSLGQFARTTSSSDMLFRKGSSLRLAKSYNPETGQSKSLAILVASPRIFTPIFATLPSPSSSTTIGGSLPPSPATLNTSARMPSTPQWNSCSTATRSGTPAGRCHGAAHSQSKPTTVLTTLGSEPTVTACFSTRSAQRPASSGSRVQRHLQLTPPSSSSSSGWSALGAPGKSGCAASADDSEVRLPSLLRLLDFSAPEVTAPAGRLRAFVQPFARLPEATAILE